MTPTPVTQTRLPPDVRPPSAFWPGAGVVVLVLAGVGQSRGSRVAVEV